MLIVASASGNRPSHTFLARRPRSQLPAMDAGGSFLDLACIRIAIVPAGPMSDARFTFLASQIAALDQLPANALPKPQQSPRRSFLSTNSNTSAATYSGLPADFRSFLQSQGTPSQNSSFSRSRSLTQQTPARRTHSLSPPRNTAAPAVTQPASSKSPPPPGSTSFAAGASPVPSAAVGSSWPGTDADADAAVRLRYIPVHRDSAGSLLIRPPSEWDNFQCRRIWGVIGVVDGTAMDFSSDKEARERALTVARAQFAAALAHFGSAAVSRLVVFTTADIARQRGSFVTVVDDADPAVPQGSPPGNAPGTATDENGADISSPSTPTVAPDSAAAATAMANATGIRVPNSPLSISSRASVMAAAAGGGTKVVPDKAAGQASGVSPTSGTGAGAERDGSSSVSPHSDGDAAQSQKPSVPSSSLPTSSSAQSLSSLPFSGSAASGRAKPPSGLPGSVTSGSPVPSPTSAAAANMMKLTGVGDLANRPISVGYVPIRSAVHAEETKLEVRAQIVHFAGLLLIALESWIHQETVTTDVFVSPLDESNATDKQSKLVKRRPGRLDKIQGDYLLMTGSPVEAMAKYNSAIERSKANGDSLWTAGAMEGASAAQVYVHVATGGRVDDSTVVSRVIEQYAEVYKLYRKKHVPELEAASALRLAEFLGRWTYRRKDALGAVEFSATVAEGLRAPKKQVLWEALARFSEYMGCRRKAALFLYRLGLLDANEDNWGKAVSLMTASAAQFRPDKSSAKTAGAWPDLHRQVLLEAANAGLLSGDLGESARHSMEALSLSPAIPRTVGASDTSIVNSLLYGGHVPAWLECADELVNVIELSAVQISSLSIEEHKPDLGRNSSGKIGSGDGGKDPFLYNPFAARAAAAKAAEAGRAVTWVCGETAHIALTIRNCLKTRVAVEVIAVSIAEAGEEERVWPVDQAGSVSNALGEDEAGKEKDISELGDVDAVADMKSALRLRTRRMRSILRAISRISTTISQTLDLVPVSSADEDGRKSGVSKFRLSVVPRRAGTMRVCGIVLRLFSGAIVMLPAPAADKCGVEAPPIEVMAPLPKLDVAIHAEVQDTSARFVSHLPIDVFEGEHRRLSVQISNAGSDAIADARIQTNCEGEGIVRVISDGTDPAVQSDVACLGLGASRTFDVQVYAVRRRGPVTSDMPRAVSITIDVEYTGQKRKSYLRTTRATAVLNVSPAVFVESLSHVRYHMPEHAVSLAATGAKSPAAAASDGDEDAPKSKNETVTSVASGPPSKPHLGAEVSFPVHGMVINVGTRAAAPVQVGVVPMHEGPVGTVMSFEDADGLEAYKSTLVEPGACARLLTPLHSRVGCDLEDAESFPRSGVESGTPMFSLKWVIPSFGRNGVVPLFDEEIKTVLSNANASPVKDLHVLDLSPTSASLFRNLAASVKIHIQDRDDPLAGATTPSVGNPGAGGGGGGVGSGCGSSDIDGGSLVGAGAVQRLHLPATLVTARRFYQLRIEIRNIGSKAFPEPSTLDVCVCQLDGLGGSVPVGLGVLVGGHEGVSCGGLEPGASQWHSLRLRLCSAGLYDVVANVYDAEAAIKAFSLDEFLLAKEHNEGTSAGPAVSVDVGVPRLSPTASPTASPLVMSPPADVAASPSGAQSQEQGPQHPSSQRSSLKRVGLTRRRRSEGNIRRSPGLCGTSGRSPISSLAVQPFSSCDEGDSIGVHRNSPAIACGRITVRAVNDTRWSTGGLLGNLASQPGAESSVASPSPADLSSLNDPHRHLHGPDTIVQ